MKKQDKIMFQIVREIVTGARRAGTPVLRKEYNLNFKQMAAIFRILACNNIIERQPNSTYAVNDRATKNAQEFCCDEIIKRFEDIEDIADSGNISDEMLVELFRLHMSERGGK